MDLMSFSIIAVVGVLYFLYVRVIKRRNTALEALSGIDVQLTKRHNLMPNILKIAQRLMTHEKTLLLKITELRTSLNNEYNKQDTNAIKKHIDDAVALDSSLSQLMVSVENYPKIKSDKAMVEAMATYNEVEAHISAARRFYNAAVSDLNSSVQIFPSSLIAKIISVKAMPFYRADDAHHVPVDVSDYLK
ncbi:LemA family protein [Photobacterium kagoshimensis]|uniref:LemA family protein n=1 Tax=Photobacterium kagoshimensis TaxID=2910242 RepID=UPI003D10F022